MQSKSGTAAPHSKTQATIVRLIDGPHFGVRQCPGALDARQAYPLTFLKDNTCVHGDNENALYDGWAMEMLRARAHADEPGGNLSQNWKPFQQTKHERN
jgi:hypothetical protein